MTTAKQGEVRDLPVGNFYDKYGARNPVARHLTTRFRQELDALWERTAPATQLDVGCGEGVLTHEWACTRADTRLVGLDLEDPGLRAEWDSRCAPNLEFVSGDAQQLPYEDDSFDLVTAIEVLEHLPDPQLAAQHMARIARSYLLLSVPREPLWSALNMLRGAYWSSWGNTPGHIQRWSRRSFVEFASQFGEVVEVHSPLPWTIVLVRVGGAGEGRG